MMLPSLQIRPKPTNGKEGHYREALGIGFVQKTFLRFEILRIRQFTPATTSPAPIKRFGNIYLAAAVKENLFGSTEAYLNQLHHR